MGAGRSCARASRRARRSQGHARRPGAARPGPPHGVRRGPVAGVVIGVEAQDRWSHAHHPGSVDSGSSSGSARRNSSSWARRSTGRALSSLWVPHRPPQIRDRAATERPGGRSAGQSDAPEHRGGIAGARKFEDRLARNRRLWQSAVRSFGGAARHPHRPTARHRERGQTLAFTLGARASAVRGIPGAQ